MIVPLRFAHVLCHDCLQSVHTSNHAWPCELLRHGQLAFTFFLRLGSLGPLFASTSCATSESTLISALVEGATGLERGLAKGLARELLHRKLDREFSFRSGFGLGDWDFLLDSIRVGVIFSYK